MRRAASLLSKVVDSLAPSITNVLVQGKQVSIFFRLSLGHNQKSFWIGLFLLNLASFSVLGLSITLTVAQVFLQKTPAEAKPCLKDAVTK